MFKVNDVVWVVDGFPPQKGKVCEVIDGLQGIPPAYFVRVKDYDNGTNGGALVPRVGLAPRSRELAPVVVQVFQNGP